MWDDYIKYTNGRGQVLHLGKKPYYIEESDLRNFEWSYNQANGKLNKFKRDTRTNSIVVKVIGNQSDIDAVYDITQADIVDYSYGTLEINGYTYMCRIYAGEYSEYLMSKKYCKISLKVVSPYPVWMSFTPYRFIKTVEVAAAGKSYPYGYDYDYGEGGLANSVDGKGIEPNGFQMIIKGPVSNPEVVIGEHMYKVNTDVKVGETLTITAYGGKKTIYREGLTLSPVNEYSKRYLPESVFEPIQIGRQPVIWDGTFAFDLTLVEERSTPPWI